MLHEIKNDVLTVKVAEHGAEVYSAIGADGFEYIWQRDPKYWGGCMPVLFPICGKLYGGKFLHDGKEYALGSHGLARHQEFVLTEQTDNSLKFTLKSNEATKAIYPFDFTLDMIYTIDGKALTITANIKNDGDAVMPFTYGAHPAFNIPLADGAAFEDHYLEFSEECEPNRIEVLPIGMISGVTEKYPLEDKRIMRLNREMFAIDGVFMNRIASEVTLKTDRSSRAVTVKYGGFPYVGIWQKYGDTPFICIEPWQGLPDYNIGTREIMQKHDMFHLEAGEEKTISYTVIFN